MEVITHLYEQTIWSLKKKKRQTTHSLQHFCCCCGWSLCLCLIYGCIEMAVRINIHNLRIFSQMQQSLQDMELQRMEEQIQDRVILQSTKIKLFQFPTRIPNITSGLLIPVVLFWVALRSSSWGVALLCVVSPFSSDILTFLFVPRQDLSILCSCSLLDRIVLLLILASSSCLWRWSLPTASPLPLRSGRPFSFLVSFCVVRLWSLSCPWAEPSQVWQRFSHCTWCLLYSSFSF